MPFSGTVVSLVYANKHRDTLVKLLAVLDKSVDWFDDASHRSEAVDILVSEMKSPRQPVERSYDFLRRIDYFARSNEVSRARVGNLMTEMRALGDIKSDITPDKVAVPGLTRLVD
jgi:ABC-type nitrate/sulfonate/bicarbonate transport system substrate-binding protein